MSSDYISSRTRSKSRQSRSTTSDVHNSGHAVVVNVQMAERTENTAEEAAVDDMEEWSDASGVEPTSVNEEREDSRSGPDECASEEPSEAANQQSLLHTIVAAIAPLDKKMDGFSTTRSLKHENSDQK